MDNVEDLEVKCEALDAKVKQIYVTENNKVKPITDGIFDIQEWLNSKYRILWILKEPYDDIDKAGNPIGGGWDLKKDIVKNLGLYAKIRTWRTIIYTSYGLLNNLFRNDINDIEDDPSISNIIKKISLINIKKTPGLKQSRYQPIKIAYERNKELLQNQIEIYNPNIIIGVRDYFDLFFDYLGISDSLQTNENENLYYVEKKTNLYIAAFHPAQRNKGLTQEKYVNDIIRTVKKWSSK